MTSTVVLGYDGSDAARAALQYAGERSADGGHLFVVCVSEPPPAFLGDPYYQRVLDASLGHARDLGEEARGLLPPGADVATELMQGSPSEAIVKVAQTRDADEIVVGSRGLGKVRAALGSVSQDVLHLADRPVVVIPNSNSNGNGA
jgi:nucleotide-binding universal stress UspA family protein